MKNLIIISACLIIILTAINGCRKDQPVEPGKAQYAIRMTDAPGPYSEVNIDLKAIEITGPGSPVMLNVNAGIYNLFNFANGVDTLIGTGSITAGKVSQIRLILGPNNTVKVNGIIYPLSTPSAMQSGLKLQVHQDLQAGVAYDILLDFDANQSVVDLGNGGYALKPVIRTIDTAISGAIKGQLSPAVAATVTAVSTSGNTYTAGTNANGEFLLQGLPPGSYTITVTPVSPYTGTTISNVLVSVGSTTQLGLVHI